MILKPNSKEALLELQQQVENTIASLGYEVVAIEQSQAGAKAGRTLTVFIDFLNNQEESKRIGLDDCMAVNRAIDELFENTLLLDGNYTLEVSSPGVERPLRKALDYSRFAGRKARLHTFRSLEKEELENSPYWEKNRKQKNFVGQLQGLSTNGLKVQMNIDGQEVYVPLDLISKAHLEFVESINEGARK